MRNGVEKILKAKNTGTRVRFDSFFKVTTNTSSPKSKTEDVKEGDHCHYVPQSGCETGKRKKLWPILLLVFPHT